MSTGDLANNFHRLQSLLRAVKYPQLASLDLDSIKSSKTFLRLLHWLLLDYSTAVAHWLNSDLGIDLRGRTDSRFIDGVYKLLISDFKYTPRLRKDLFLLDNQFVERRVLVMIDCVELVRNKHLDLVKRQHGVGGGAALQSRLIEVIEDPPVVDTFHDSDGLLSKSRLHSDSGFLSRSVSVTTASTIDQRRRALSEFHRSIQHPLSSHSQVTSSTHVTEDHEKNDAIFNAPKMDRDSVHTWKEPTEFELHDDYHESPQTQHDMTIEELSDGEISLQKDTPSIPAHDEQEEVLQMIVEQVAKLTTTMVSFMERLERSETKLLELSRQLETTRKHV